MDTLHIEADDFAGLAGDMLRAGREIRFRARGASMSPFIRDGDIVTVQPARADDLRPGDVALYVRSDGQVMLHRVLGRDRHTTPPLIITRGDARTGPREPVAPEQILGRAIASSRGARTFRLNAATARLSGLLWAHTQPLGFVIMAAGRFVRQHLRASQRLSRFTGRAER